MEFVGIDKMSLVDFDDYLSVTLFTEGCNFRCPFCHNRSLVLKENTSPINFNEILDYLKTRVNKIDAVVITGGEPLLHPDIVEKIKAIKDLGFLIKLDTNGTNPDLMIKLLESKLVDYVAMDIKNCKEKYNLTSGSNLPFDNIEKSIKFLINSNYNYEFRTTAIKEFHTLEDFIKIANMIKGCKRYVLQHYKDREECIEHGFHEIDENTIIEYKKEIDKILGNVDIRGY